MLTYRTYPTPLSACSIDNRTVAKTLYFANMSTQNVMQRTPPNNLLRTNTVALNESRSLEDVRKPQYMDTMPLLSPESQKHLPQRIKRRREVASDELADELSEFKKDMKDMIKELISAQNTRMDNLEKHMLDMKNQFSTVKDTNKDIEVAMNSMSSQLTSLEAQISGLESQRNEIATQVCTIEDKLEALDKNLVKSSIEIRNVPKRPTETKESLFYLIKTLAQTLNVALQPHDIRDVSRQPSKRETQVSAVTVEFSNTLIKSQILNSTKEFNKANGRDKLNSSHLGLGSPKTPIYVAEQLTKTTKRLYFLARALAKAENYAFCWVSNGRILLRRDKDGPHIIVKDEYHLKQLSTKNTGA